MNFCDNYTSTKQPATMLHRVIITCLCAFLCCSVIAGTMCSIRTDELEAHTLDACIAAGNDPVKCGHAQFCADRGHEDNCRME